ncbi:lipid-binding SYLF domain-containing protein [Maribacter spongiicola]|uniref:Lipid-binding SYLF domain-containing protein n=1 Tax=Maribacter spongiicola TaxID=1206753 RepID=A0A4R7K856_9FLAO|nr:lipid-binding SYLF domain-containing protein [Maribacter spongiicola]TDT47260.1 lipid-binding SYLF domain-containing protein [Maribacter spongiicola]
MKILKSITAVAFLFLAVGVNAQNTKDKKVIKDADKAKEKLMTMEVGLDQFFTNSAGYVIFPNVGKGGFIIGGASGNGVVYENGAKVGMADLKKLSVGLQAGGQAITEVIFFETAGDLAEFKDGDFEFSAEASAVALKSGIAVNAKYKDGVAVFALPKAGLMADASVGGQKFDYKPMMK